MINCPEMWLKVIVDFAVVFVDVEQFSTDYHGRLAIF